MTSLAIGQCVPATLGSASGLLRIGSRPARAGLLQVLLTGRGYRLPGEQLVVDAAALVRLPEIEEIDQPVDVLAILAPAGSKLQRQ